MSIGKIIKCDECKDALETNEEDPCTDSSLIDVQQWQDIEGLQTPSGSVCKLITLCEKIVRKHSTQLSTPQIEHVMLKEVLKSLDSNQIFPILSVFHSMETAIGCDNHYTNLVRIISRKYLKLHIKKLCQDEVVQRSHGNSILRSRVFRGL